MNSLNAALLVNLLGFSIGIALFGLLAVMVVRHRRSSHSAGVNYLLLATATLGLIWNLGELIVSIQRDFGYSPNQSFLVAAAYSALGFLPSVVVHSAQNEADKAKIPVWLAYALSVLAMILHFRAAITGEAVPSALAMQAHTIGAVTLAAILLFFNFRDTIERKAIWAAALLVFAVSSLHLSEQRSENSWLIEMVAHQSSLPLALTILYQNYRFAFADLFLKRAISLILVALLAFGLYVAVAAPLLRYHETHDRNDVFAVTLILALWIATALVYPVLHKFAEWLVDRVVLQRANYEKLQSSISAEIEPMETVEEVLDVVTSKLAKVLTAGRSEWRTGDFEIVVRPPNIQSVAVRTAEKPEFEIVLGEFYGGRRLLSDESAMLESVSRITARRIDSIRVVHERCEREFKEQEYSKLTAEAQLKALRSQINPHFLFNALTTIGYLIETSPQKAMQTLLHLTKLLRGVLSATGEFSTLGEEIDLIENYLDIERARFEERLTVSIDVPDELRQLRIPSLIIQPLVENAIKHGISGNRSGGEVLIAAERVSGGLLILRVRDSGAAKKLRPVNDNAGVGLANIRERLATYYGDRGALDLAVGNDGWTTAEIRIPIESRIRKAA